MLKDIASIKPYWSLKNWNDTPLYSTAIIAYDGGQPQYLCFLWYFVCRCVYAGYHCLKILIQFKDNVKHYICFIVRQWSWKWLCGNKIILVRCIGTGCLLGYHHYHDNVMCFGVVQPPPQDAADPCKTHGGDMAIWHDEDTLQFIFDLIPENG